MHVYVANIFFCILDFFIISIAIIFYMLFNWNDVINLILSHFLLAVLLKKLLTIQ